MKALLFDLYGVLLTEQSADDIAAIEAAAGVGGPRFWQVYWDERPDYDAGLITAGQYWERVASSLGTVLADPEALQAVDIVSWTGHDPEMVAYVSSLVESGVRVGILSNIPREVASAVLASDELFAGLSPRLLSNELGLAKPDPRIYERAVERFGLSADDILFIDDRPVNVDAAVASGLRGHVFAGIEGLRPAVASHLGTTP